MEQLNEKDIIALCLSETTANRGFQILVEQFSEKLYWHIRRMVIDHDDADDILQDTFVKVWKNIGGFRQDSSLFTWLYRIATNECLTFLKTKKRKGLLWKTDYDSILIERLEDTNVFSGDEIEKKLHKAILTLPEKQRLVFNMKYFDEMKYAEMSDVLGTSVGALKASYHLAVKKIEEYVSVN